MRRQPVGRLTPSLGPSRVHIDARKVIVRSNGEESFPEFCHISMLPLADYEFSRKTQDQTNMLVRGRWWQMGGAMK